MKFKLEFHQLASQCDGLSKLASLLFRKITSANWRSDWLIGRRRNQSLWSGTRKRPQKTVRARTEFLPKMSGIPDRAAMVFFVTSAGIINADDSYWRMLQSASWWRLLAWCRRTRHCKFKAMNVLSSPGLFQMSSSVAACFFVGVVVNILLPSSSSTVPFLVSQHREMLISVGTLVWVYVNPSMEPLTWNPESTHRLHK